MTAGEPGGTLRDAIARKLSQYDLAVAMRRVTPHSSTDRADFVLAALREHLSAHPESLSELGWEQASPSYPWYRVAAPPVPTHPGERQ